MAHCAICEEVFADDDEDVMELYTGKFLCRHCYRGILKIAGGGQPLPSSG